MKLGPIRIKFQEVLTPLSKKPLYTGKLNT